MANNMPTPRYKIGDTVWFASTNGEGKGYPCPDCEATGKWLAVSPTGTEAPISCPRCDGRAKLVEHAYAASVAKRTIGQVRMEWPKSAFGQDDDPISYMCSETGIGGGSIYREGQLFPTEEEAVHAAEALAAGQNLSLDERQPERKELRHLFAYQIKDALVGEEQRKRRDAEYAYQALIGRICELDTYPIAKRLDEDGEETGDNYLSCHLTDEQVECIQNALVKFDDAARRELVDYRKESTQ